jgi:tetratricopeptide (TPR) repeat protein
MILFLDVALTDEGAERPDSRQPASTPDCVDVFKYQLASLAVLPWSRVILAYDLAAPYTHRRADLKAYARSLFPDLILCDAADPNATPVEAVLEAVLAHAGTEPIWCSADPTVIFIDYERELLAHIESRLQELAQTHRYVACHLLRWPELLTGLCPQSAPAEQTAHLLETQAEGFVTLSSICDRVQIVNAELLRYWRLRHRLQGRSHPTPNAQRPIPTASPPLVDHIAGFVPLRELTRPFAGYDGLDYNVCPPLFIPPGFFKDSIRIQYGAAKRKPEHVLVNPLLPNYSAVDPDGADCRCTLKDLPLFWRSRIATIESDPEADPGLFTYHRDAAVLKIALSQFSALPAGLLGALRPALRTTDPGRLSRLLADVSGFADSRPQEITADRDGYRLVRFKQWYFALAHTLGQVSLSDLYAMAFPVRPSDEKWFVSDSEASCREFLASRTLLAFLERADLHRALRLSLSDFLRQKEVREAVALAPFGLSPVDTWAYLHLLARALPSPDRPIPYREVTAALQAAQALLSAEAAPPDSYLPKAQGEATIPWYANLLHQLDYETASVEYARLMAMLLPPVSMALTGAQLQMASGNIGAADARLLETLTGCSESPLDYTAVLCCLAAQRWTHLLFTDDHTGSPGAQRAFTLLRDLNCRLLAHRGVQQALVGALPMADIPAQAAAYTALGEALFTLEQAEGAEAAFLAATALSPQSALIHNDLAVLYWSRSRRSEALAHLQEAMRLDPNHPDVVTNAAAMLGKAA